MLALCRPLQAGIALAIWLLLVAMLAATLGLAAGSIRVAAIDSGAMRAPPGREVELSGHLATTPRYDADGSSAELDTANGRVLLRAPDLEGLGAGAGVRVRGRLAAPQPWRAGFLRRHGIAMTLEAEGVESGAGNREGLQGRLDGIRSRAERALERGMPGREAALARGFVLGQDDQIDAATREDFRRAGLTHLLAVSGQNVILLCLLAWPLLALCGLTLRARLTVLLCLIAVYVPVTGAGPSIQRAGVMGAAGVIAALAGRPRSRWYALLLAALVTLALNPRASGDVGWQLSFAAVVGIFAWTPRLAALMDGGAEPGSARRALAEGIAMTVAATLATAPLMAHHFGSISAAALPANVLALPAVAPAMWLGMLAGIVGQLPALPVEPLNWLDSLCLAYIGQVAHWLGSPGWALVALELERPQALVAAYAGLTAVVELGLAAAAGRRGLGPLPAPARRVVLASTAALAALLTLPLVHSPGAGSADAPGNLTIRVMDVGQGDAILLDPPGGAPILVDSGPSQAHVAARLRELRAGALAALVVTHDQSDHAGGVAELIRSNHPGHLVLAAGSSRLAALAGAGGPDLIRLGEGGELRSAELRLSVLWPPRELLGMRGEDPNQLSLVLLAEWRHFSMLLTADAEAELARIDPGPVDVLKVAHHGSGDAGLDALLAQAAPRLAVISVGENSYGHPAAQTLSDLAEHDVPVARTDRDGEIVIEVDPAGWRVGQ